MSLETISITRQCPIINGFCQLLNNNPSGKTSVPVAAFIALTGGVVNRLSQDSGMGRGGRRFGPQEWVEFTEPHACCQEDATLEAGKTAYGTNTRTDIDVAWNAQR